MDVLVATPGQGLSLPPVGANGSILVSNGTTAVWTNAPVIRNSIQVLDAAGASSFTWATGKAILSHSAGEPALLLSHLSAGVKFGEFKVTSSVVRIGAMSTLTNFELYADAVLHMAFGGGKGTMFGNLAFDAGTRLVGDVQNQNLLDKTAAETITGVYTHAADIAFDAGTRLVGDVQNQNLLDKTAAETITGIYEHQAAFLIKPNVTGSMTGFTMDLTDYQGGPLKPAVVYTLGTLSASDATVLGTNYGLVKGLTLNLTNANLSKLGTGKGQSPGPALTISHTNHPDAAPGDIVTLDVELIANQVASGSSYTGSQIEVSANSSGSGTGGVIGCFFQANNANAAGKATGLIGWAQLDLPTSTGDAVAMFGNVVNFGGSTSRMTGLHVDFVGALDSSYQYALRVVDGHLMLKGGLWITTETDVIGSNPSTHLAIATGSAANQTLFVKEDAEIDGTLYLDGDLRHFGTNVSFFGVAATPQSAAYTPSNVTAVRTFDADATTLPELADVVGTLLADLQLTGLIG